MFFMCSTFISFGTNIDELLSPPYSTSEISGLGIAVSIVGVTASILWGLALKRYHNFVLQIRIYCFATTLFYAVA